ncbi:histidine kinase N-terminal 7TM domain-containing protein [Haloarcula laminariae]|uniref:histidine kinase N-terminal 7TM domain-containing protein n=1 Tax=Haloarcula laminariae TaxID=2961577 RepID=UPI002407153E|nr:histidine kinase N-terminal 7TM domain-containing protein [Halomicroarcula sp. FL173]
MKLALLASIAVGVTTGLLAWRERPEPGAVPLVLLMAGQCWWSATLIFRIEAATLGMKVLFSNSTWLGVAIIPAAWLLFALEYGGYNEYTTRRHVLLIMVVPAITAFLGLTDQFHHLIYLDATLIHQDGILSLSRTPGPWFWVIAVYTYLLGFLGLVPLLKLITSQVRSFRGQSLALFVGLVAPWATNLAHLSGYLPTAGIDPTPVAFTLSGVAYLSALTQFKLFGASPTPIRHARRSLYEQMHQGALVLDTHGTIVDMNDRAAAVLGTTTDRALGEHLETVSPELTAIGDTTGQHKRVFTPQGTRRTYDVSESPVTDVHDRTIGRIITLHDISDLFRMQQRLEVLHRVFRHNIRTNIQVILGYAGYLATHNSQSKAETLKRNAMEIEATGEKVREIIDVFEEGRKEREKLRLHAILRECVDATAEAYPGVTVEYDPGPEDLLVDSLFDIVCSNVIENAAQHNTSPEPWVHVSVEAGEGSVEVRVADNGPGIEDHELALVEEGTETPLKHGSGFGLALTAWGTDIAGGSVEFESDESGTCVVLEMPVAGRGETLIRCSVISSRKNVAVA